MENVRAWAVHALTASGAAIALFAAVAAARGNWQLVFVSLGIAMIVDGIDGPLARRYRIDQRLPWFDGGILDQVVDYTTYVFIPAFVLSQSGLLPEPYATIGGVIVATVGALYFADTRMKTPEAAFRGFPAVWNTVVFQLMVFKPPEFFTVLIILVFAVLTFTPVEFIHPLRVKRLRPLTLFMSLAWSILAVVAVAADFSPNRWVLIAFGVTAVYFAFIGLALQLTQPKSIG
jgi:phosphatidylcholine synthase